jgi:hypothetical protein
MASTVNSTLAEELYKACPAPGSTDQDLSAGCILGIHKKFCVSADPSLPCREEYLKAFGASIYKKLGETCPSWKDGVASINCVKAYNLFNASVSIGDGQMFRLTRTHARVLVTSLFGNVTYAPK